MEQNVDMQPPAEATHILPETFQVGHITVTTFPLEHDRLPQDVALDSGQTGSQFFEDLVGSHDMVMTEYNSDEFDRIPRLWNYYKKEIEERHDYFKALEDIARKHDKPLLLADPSYDQWFEFTLKPQTDFVAAGAITWGIGVSELFHFLDARTHHDVNTQPQSMSRRRFLEVGGKAVLGATAVKLFGQAFEGMDNMDKENRYDVPIAKFSEADLRRTIIAQGLHVLGKNPEYAGKRIILAYPPVHCQGIKDKVQDPNLQASFNAYTALLKGPLADKFLQVRRYTPTETGWDRIPNIPIQ